MTDHKYSFQKYDSKTMSRVVGRSLSISTKQSIEICSYLRGRTIERAKAILKDAIELKKPIPYKKFNADVGHKKGKIAAGRFPVNASTEILKLLNACQSNANFKGLNTENMIIVHINAHRGAQQWHYGRLRRRKMKRTHVELVLEESTKKARPKKEKKPVAKSVKPVAKKEEAPVKKEVQKTAPKAESKKVSKEDKKLSEDKK